MKAPTLDAGAVLILAGAGVLAYLLWRANSITSTATNAAGAPVRAYALAAQAGPVAGAVGQLGAVANAASGGTLASLGEWLGDVAFDLWGPTPDKLTPARPSTGDFARMDRAAQVAAPWALGAPGWDGLPQP